MNSVLSNVSDSTNSHRVALSAFNTDEPLFPSYVTQTAGLESQQQSNVQSSTDISNNPTPVKGNNAYYNKLITKWSFTRTTIQATERRPSKNVETMRPLK